MTAIRTKENLVDKISQDHVWRLREISELRGLIEDTTISELRKRVLCRAGVALLYAHWEGFVKKSGTYFLQYVAAQGHNISELRSNFVTLLVRGKIDKASESNKYSAFAEVTRYIIDNQTSRARFPVKNVVDTKSNLSTNVLKEIIWCLGLNYDHFETKKNIIDLKLVGRRNHVAHGESMEVEVRDFFEMVGEVIGLMATFKNLLENSCVTESYKAA
ncbi:MAE_28990/MAE_18760 family HEPN-like nuclease [Microbulbifer sp. TYP-18]|uniref:MAE_28990/MAE_18760 family HEPN-like nuclease n=1 Tax=Microbulbifer sp. TYP-18 TaxID=3230024 RepID=UPI0034C6D6F3